MQPEPSAALESFDSLALPPLPSDDGHDDMAIALAEQRLRAKLLGEPQRGLQVDRYALERQLGAGGMGSVWRAWDEQLQRVVALKFLHRSHETRAGQRRFEREAQGLAQLAHPNVIGVYDLGHHDQRAWIAMEFVPGRTLREWQAQEQPSAAELLAAWLAAGRGLAAVHATGLLHRDVKPDNIMMGEDARVRLVDFGLVSHIRADVTLSSQAPSQLASGEGSTTQGAVEGDADHTATTAAGSFVGTPAYAAPEQLAGLPLDARADQYAFCVSLWEALTGARPPTPKQRQQGSQLRSLEGASVPPRVRRALERGLELDPDARFEHMDALLDALSPRQRRWLVPGIAATLAGALGVGLGLAKEPEPVDPCAGASAELEGYWTADRREMLAERYGPQRAEHLDGVIEGWARQWGESATQSCQAHAAGELASEADYEGRRACLSGAARELDRLLEAVGAGELRDPTVLLTWLAELPEPSTCEHKAVPSAPPAELQTQIHALEDQLSRLRYNLDDIPLAERLVLAERLHDQARALAWPALVGRSTKLSAQLNLDGGALEPARAAYGKLFDLGLQYGDALAVFSASAGMAEAELALSLDPDASTWWIAREAAAMEALGAPAFARAEHKTHEAHAAQLHGELDRAEAGYGEAIELWREAGPRQHPNLAHALHRFGNFLTERNRALEAEASFAEALELEAAGVPAPLPAEVEDLDEGVNALMSGDTARAIKLFERALERTSVQESPRSMTALRAHIGLSGAHDARGELEPALEHALAAEAIARTTMGPAHPRRGEALSALGVAQYRGREFDASASSFERALAISVKHTPPGNLDRALAELNLGDALYESEGDDLRAQLLLERARATLADQLGDDHPVLAVALKALGGLYLRAGQSARALEHLSAAAQIASAQQGTEVERAEIDWLLAQAHASAEQLPEARARGAAALVAFTSLGPQWQARAAEVQTWLDTLAPAP